MANSLSYEKTRKIQLNISKIMAARPQEKHRDMCCEYHYRCSLFMNIIIMNHLP